MLAATVIILLFLTNYQPFHQERMAGSIKLVGGLKAHRLVWYNGSQKWYSWSLTNYTTVRESPIHCRLPSSPILIVSGYIWEQPAKQSVRVWICREVCMCVWFTCRTHWVSVGVYDSGLNPKSTPPRLPDTSLLHVSKWRHRKSALYRHQPLLWII